MPDSVRWRREVVRKSTDSESHFEFVVQKGRKEVNYRGKFRNIRRCVFCVSSKEREGDREMTSPFCRHCFIAVPCAFYRMNRCSNEGKLRNVKHTNLY